MVKYILLAEANYSLTGGFQMIKTVVKIDGMACGMCESHVNDAIRSLFKVKKVSSSHSRGEAVIISEEVISEEKLREALDPTGYRVLSVKSEAAEKQSFLAKLFRK